MTDYWEDESDGKPRHGVGVVRHRPHRIVRHRMVEPIRHWAKIGFVVALVTVSAATLATSVAVRDTRAAARWAAGEGAGNALSGSESDDQAPPEDPATVGPSEDAERRTQVGASTERATRERRPASSVPAAPSAPASSSGSPSTDPTPPPGTSGGPDPCEPPDVDPSPEPTPDPEDPKGQTDGEEPEPEHGDSGESTGGDSGEPADGADRGEVPPVDGEPAPAQSETGS